MSASSPSILPTRILSFRPGLNDVPRYQSFPTETKTPSALFSLVETLTSYQLQAHLLNFVETKHQARVLAWVRTHPSPHRLLCYHVGSWLSPHNPLSLAVGCSSKEGEDLIFLPLETFVPRATLKLRVWIETLYQQFEDYSHRLRQRALTFERQERQQVMEHCQTLYAQALPQKVAVELWTKNPLVHAQATVFYCWCELQEFDTLLQHFVGHLEEPVDKKRKKSTWFEALVATPVRFRFLHQVVDAQHPAYAQIYWKANLGETESSPVVHWFPFRHLSTKRPKI